MKGTDITEFRKAHGFTQSEIADAIGCTRGPLSVIERGQREISCLMEERLGRFFDFVRQSDADGRLGPQFFPSPSNRERQTA